MQEEYSDNYCVKSVHDIIRLSDEEDFYVPSYQRGYRWQKVNVTDLLNDLHEFIHNDKPDYWLQPLVVKNTGDGYYNIVDGQQRLTTIAILLNFLGERTIRLFWRSRQHQVLTRSADDSNIDQFHVNRAYDAMQEWFDALDTDEVPQDAGEAKVDARGEFRKLLCDEIDGKKLNFIWFETPDDELKTFIRLNKDKIGLTNAELVKALLLRRGNFPHESIIAQKSIAAEWDTIESLLQNDSFWFFLRPISDQRDTRIDFMLETIKSHGMLQIEADGATAPFAPDPKKIGDDKYATFRFFLEYFKTVKSAAFNGIWKHMRILYDTFTTWYNDSELFHYIGYLRTLNAIGMDELIQKWQTIDTRLAYISWLKEKIKHKIKNCADLDRCYHYPGSNDRKRETIPLLLLFNVEQTVIQNRILADKANGKPGLLTWFPFHLYKDEVWNVEHIGSSTDNSLDDDKSQREWLMSFLLDKDRSTDDIRMIIDYLRNGDAQTAYETVKTLNFDQIKRRLESKDNREDALSSEEDKNKVWNFCLLDEYTNKSYGNSIFPVKRRVIIGKSLGRQYEISLRPKPVKALDIIDANFEICHAPTRVAFVPIGTDCVFKKAYTSSSTSPRVWTLQDAREYRERIAEVLKDFGVH